MHVFQTWKGSTTARMQPRPSKSNYLTEQQAMGADFNDMVLKSSQSFLLLLISLKNKMNLVIKAYGMPTMDQALL